MKMTPEEFVLHFHSLNGTTVAERQKNLCLLLKNFKQDELSDFDFSKIQPKNLLEEKLKVNVLIYFKRVPELLEILKSENPEDIRRIFKIDQWFFETAFGNITGDDLVTGVFPFVSFNVKVKLLNKLSNILRNAQQGDDVFKRVKDVYGLHLASKILPACSYDLIVQILETHKLKLPPKQLCSIIERHPEHKETFLKIIRSFNIEKECNNVLKFFKKTDVLAFIVLHKEYKLSQKLGWRTTDKFISKNKNKVIADPNTYYKILHNKQINKSLGKDFATFFRNVFPTDINAFLQERKSIVSKLNLLSPKSNPLDLYLSTFSSVYGSEIWEHPQFVTVKLLKMLDPHERNKRLKDDYRTAGVSEDEWKCLYDIQTSIPFLKKRISLTSDIQTRAQLVGFLVDTCKINEDQAALNHVCKYMLSKHRNDHISVRLAFLRQIRDNFVLENLDEEHWLCINEFIQIFQMNQESFYDNFIFFEGYVHYRLKNNMPIKEQLTQWITDGERQMNLIKSVPTFERSCLLVFGEIVLEVAKDEKLFVEYLCALYNFNCRNRTEEIPLFAYPRSIDALKRNISEFGWKRDVSDILIFFLNNVKSEEKSEYIKLLLNAANQYLECTPFVNLLKKDPVLIAENVEDIVHFIVKTQSNKIIFLKNLRYYHYLNLPQAVVACCKTYDKYLEDCYRYEKQRIEESAFVALSFLMAKEEFLACVSSFYPEERRACADKVKFTKQKLCCRTIKNIYPVSDALSSALNFCKGDYLKLVLASLYSICGNINEDKLLPVLNELSNRAASVRKHSLHLAFRHMNRQCIYNAINKFMEAKPEVSIRKFILKVLFNFFAKNPNDYTWDLLKASVNILDGSDVEAVDLFLETNKVPREYLVPYLLFAWNFLQKLPDPFGKLNSKRATLLNSVGCSVCQMVPVDFCQNIINSYLFHSDEVDIFNIAVQKFACCYIIYSTERTQQEERLKLAFEMMKHYISSKWSHHEVRSKARGYCSKFLQTFCSIFLTDRNANKDVLQNLFDMWNSILQPHEAFRDYLYLKFTLMYLQRHSLQQLAKDLIDFCNNLIEIYGFVIIEFLYNVFREFSEKLIKEEGEDYNCKLIVFIEELINSKSNTGLLMATLMLEDDSDLDSKAREKKDGIIQTLGNQKNVGVDLFLYRHIKGKTTLHYY